MPRPRLNAGTCSIPDCGRPAFAKKLCKRCYSYQWRTGSTREAGMREKPSEAEIKAHNIESSTSARRELAMAREAYDCAATLACRMFWSVEVRRLLIELNEAESAKVQAPANDVTYQPISKVQMGAEDLVSPNGSHKSNGYLVSPLAT